MPRLVATLITATALIAIFLPASAGAESKTCTAHTPQVSGGIATGIVNSSQVNDVQARFATCRHLKKVMKKAIGLDLEKPRSIRSFFCKPTVLATSPAKAVRFVCTFKGADTPMFVKVTFNVVYRH